MAVACTFIAHFPSPCHSHPVLLRLRSKQGWPHERDEEPLKSISTVQHLGQRCSTRHDWSNRHDPESRSGTRCDWDESHWEDLGSQMGWRVWLGCLPRPIIALNGIWLLLGGLGWVVFVVIISYTIGGGRLGPFACLDRSRYRHGMNVKYRGESIYL